MAVVTISDVITSVYDIIYQEKYGDQEEDAVKESVLEAFEVKPSTARYSSAVDSQRQPTSQPVALAKITKATSGLFGLWLVDR